MTRQSRVFGLCFIQSPFQYCTITSENAFFDGSFFCFPVKHGFRQNQEVRFSVINSTFHSRKVYRLPDRNHAPYYAAYLIPHGNLKWINWSVSTYNSCSRSYGKMKFFINQSCTILQLNNFILSSLWFSFCAAKYILNLSIQFGK